jgi:hypothetical protein
MGMNHAQNLSYIEVARKIITSLRYYKSSAARRSGTHLLKIDKVFHEYEKSENLYGAQRRSVVVGEFEFSFARCNARAFLLVNHKSAIKCRQNI